MPPKISLSMIVKDGAETLGRCLASVRELVGEMIVVDTGSQDATRAIAEACGARVYDFHWTDSFADARNASLDLCQGDWIFWLDADEWLDLENQNRLRALIARLPEENTVYLMNQVSQQADGGELAVSQARLFRKVVGVRWNYRVHEQILPACKDLGFQQARAPIAIRHSGYAAEALSRTKEDRNRRLLHFQHNENPDDTWVLFQLGKIEARDHPDEARSFLRRALEKTRPDDPLRRRLHSLLVEIDMTQGTLDEARWNVKQALDEFPNDTNLLSHAGYLAVESFDLAGAEMHFRKLLDNAPDLDEFLASVDLSLRGFRTRHNLAVVRDRQGDPREAESLWHQNAAETVDPGFSWLWLAGVAQKEERWDALADALSRLNDARDVKSLQVRAGGFFALKKFDSARTLLMEWIALEPRNLLPRLILSQAFIKLGHLDDAEAALLEILEIDPNHAEAKHNLRAVRDYREERDLDDEQ